MGCWMVLRKDCKRKVTENIIKWKKLKVDFKIKCDEFGHEILKQKEVFDIFSDAAKKKGGAWAVIE